MKRTIRLFYLFQIFFSLLLWLPIFYEYQKRMGLGDTQIFSIQSLYYTAFCLFEIPTGLIGDKWGYRFCLQSGSVVLVLANLVAIYFPTYLGFTLHFLLIALSRSLISGAASAYIYEQLDRTGSVSLYKQIEGSARAYGLLVKVVSWGIVGPLMQWKLALPYWLSVGSALISVVFALLLPALPKLESNQQTAIREKTGGVRLIVDFKRIGAILTSSPGLVFLMVQGVALFVLARIVSVNLYQPILGAKRFGLSTYGWIMAAMTLFEALGSARPGWMRKFLSDFNSVFFLTAVMALSLAWVPQAGQAATIASLCLFSIATGFAFPVQRQLLNDAIPDSSYRATVLSVESILDRAVCAWVAYLLGRSLSKDSLSGFLYGSAAITLIGLVLLYGMSKLSPQRTSTLT